MIHRARSGALAVLPTLALLAVTAGPVAAQADILLRLRSGSPLGDRVRVDSAGGFVAMGSIGQGIMPASGEGYRMMWHPYKAAFRAGYTGQGGTAWDESNIGFYSWAGGVGAIASAVGSFAFGDRSVASAQGAVALGSQNTVSGTSGFSAGTLNTCVGLACTALGWTSNASGRGAVAIGYRTTADADNSVAIGHRASTNGHTGAMVFADASTTDSLEASANNQFSVRAAGGYRLYTNATTTAGLTLNAGGSSWNVVSDRNRKSEFAELNGESVLARLRGVPVTSWRYHDEGDRTVRHVGPMAQDWHRAFGLNGDSLTINMSDFDGVNLAAIRALEARTTELRAKAAEITALRDEVARLRAKQERTEQRLARLEAALKR